MSAVRTGATFTTLYCTLCQIKASFASTTQSQTSTNQNLVTRCKSQLRWARTRSPRPLQGISWLQPMDPCHKCVPDSALETNAGTGTDRSLRSCAVQCKSDSGSCWAAYVGQLVLGGSQASSVKQLPQTFLHDEVVTDGVRTIILSSVQRQLLCMHVCLFAQGFCLQRWTDVGPHFLKTISAFQPWQKLQP